MKFSKLTSKIVPAVMALGFALGLITYFCHHRPKSSLAFSRPSTPELAKPKVLFVNSYHTGYPWSDAEEDGLLATLNIRRLKGGELDCSASHVTLRMCDMDTKRHGAEDFKRKPELRSRT